MIPHIYFDKVKKHFFNDDKKTWDWFKQSCPAFGMLSPLNMIKLGREKKVISYIEKEMRD